jgi:hypothetical protein
MFHNVSKSTACMYTKEIKREWKTDETHCEEEKGMKWKRKIV